MDNLAKLSFKKEALFFIRVVALLDIIIFRQPASYKEEKVQYNSG